MGFELRAGASHVPERCSRGEALDWLRDAGFLPRDGERGPERPATAFSRPRAVGRQASPGRTATPAPARAGERSPGSAPIPPRSAPSPTTSSAPAPGGSRSEPGRRPRYRRDSPPGPQSRRYGRRHRYRADTRRAHPVAPRYPLRITRTRRPADPRASPGRTGRTPPAPARAGERGTRLRRTCAVAPRYTGRRPSRFARAKLLDGGNAAIRPRAAVVTPATAGKRRPSSHAVDYPREGGETGRPGSPGPSSSMAVAPLPLKLDPHPRSIERPRLSPSGPRGRPAVEKCRYLD